MARIAILKSNDFKQKVNNEWKNGLNTADVLVYMDGTPGVSNSDIDQIRKEAFDRNKLVIEITQDSISPYIKISWKETLA
jgi:hypothetical protein